mmetsp:Transcript_12076/g.18133  ORF Transcript_12076/g.18133 Transcript_12076/m.18133 type:complete len:87 (-) Transcript_12076:458-718(-)
MSKNTKEDDAPSWIKRTQKETNAWKARLGQKKCGDSFEWISEGWNSSYEEGRQRIAEMCCLEYGKEEKAGSVPVMRPAAEQKSSLF